MAEAASDLLKNLLAISREQALQFALILGSGVPPLQAMAYVTPDLEGQGLKLELERWLKDPTVQRAILAQQGKPWQEMDLQERITFAIDKNYTEMAYYLYAHNYSDLEGAMRAKADTCRQALEAKIAGMAGKMDALSAFWADVKSGKLGLMPPTVVPDPSKPGPKPKSH